MTPPLRVVLNTSLKDSEIMTTASPEKKAARIAVLKGDIDVTTAHIRIER